MTVTQSDDWTFGKNLKWARQAVGQSQADLAAAMVNLGFDFHQTTIGKIERGSRKATVGEASALSQSLGLSLATLLAVDSETAVEIQAQALLRARTALERAAVDFVESQAKLAAVVEYLSHSIEKGVDNYAQGWISVQPDDVVRNHIQAQDEATARDSQGVHATFFEGLKTLQLLARDWPLVRDGRG